MQDDHHHGHAIDDQHCGPCDGLCDETGHWLAFSQSEACFRLCRLT
jgi:hypothetical protein